MQQRTFSTSVALRRTALATAFGLVLAGCGTDDDRDDPNANDAVGRTVIIGIGDDPETLNPATTTGYAEGEIGAKIFEGLIWIDGDYEPQPALAESWEVSDDGTEYTFHLRQGVLFHDGTELTSEDVRFSFEEVLGEHHARMIETMELVEEIATPDGHTIVFHLQEPFAPFMQQMTVFDGAILPAHIYGDGEDILAHPANHEPVGTGPFVFSEWDRGSAIILERNETYWDEELPRLEGVAFQVMPQASARSVGLETGEIDWVSGFYLPETDFERLESIEHVRLDSNVGIPALYFVAMNTESEVLADAEVRRGIAAGIDRERIVAQAVDGRGRPGYGPFGDGFDWITEAHGGYGDAIVYEPDTALDAITAAGFTGETLTIVYDSARADLEAAANIIADNLAEMGLGADLQPRERSVMAEQVYRDRDYDLTLQSFTSLGDPVLGLHRIYNSVEPGTEFANPTGWGDQRVDELLAEAALLPELEDRAAVYAEVSDIIIEELPTLILYDEESVDGMNADLRDYHAAADSRDQWGQIWLDE